MNHESWKLRGCVGTLAYCDGLGIDQKTHKPTACTKTQEAIYVAHGTCGILVTHRAKWKVDEVHMSYMHPSVSSSQPSERTEISSAAVDSQAFTATGNNTFVAGLEGPLATDDSLVRRILEADLFAAGRGQDEF